MKKTIYSASQNLRKRFLESGALSFLLYQKDQAAATQQNVSHRARSGFCPNFGIFTISIVALFVLITFALSAQPERKVETTVHDFMEEYTKPAVKAAKKGKPEYIEKILTEIPNFALDEQKAKWTEISQEALKTKDYEQSCKSCHKEFKKEYKKTYRKRPIQISSELIIYLKRLKK
ncbi:hypothetical protein LEP1GSC051_4097 [Leptospira sp. P2653]|nr:hypothetical protein LEP1GSC051_4097 [Leptospira sp. P2653]EMN46316.1 hypothetical protein LEP1GSC086_3280 [Leptospira weilii str. LNT 1234]QDK24146.1 hypothetical protein FHG67_16540 [Leptospira weilii]QDK28108.1 hypothetical protein FHG68_16590 [Leptospira weilii]